MTAPRTHLHLFESPARHETRFLREASAVLNAGLADEVVLVARHEAGLPLEERVAPGVRIIRVRQRTRGLPANKILALVKLAEARWGFVRAALAQGGVAVHCHSIAPLAASVTVKRALGVPLIYDAHELETERNGLRGIKQRVERHVERRRIRDCDAVICVSDSIADWYAENYAIRRPTVIRNVPEPSPPVRGRSPLRERLGLDDEAIIFLYQGGLFRGRRVESVLQAFEGVRSPRHLVFMGYGELESLVRERSSRQANVHFIPAVPPTDVLRYTAGADVGICGVENVCLSYYYSLPNKFFECVHAGLGVLAPDFPELRRVVRTWGCGWLLGEEPAAWASAFRDLTREQMSEAGARSVAARDAFTWRAEEARLIDLYREVIG